MDLHTNPENRWPRTLVFVFIFLCFSVWAIHKENQGGLDSLVESFQAPPNFSEISSVKARKQAFFAHLEPLIQAENKAISEERSYLLSLLEKKSLSAKEQTWIDSRFEAYRVKGRNPSDLLAAIDTIPTSLALAQAAIESAWGTSRFAQQANNFYGQWCFTAGCGLVPNERKADSSHEVRKFSTADLSVASYIRNLNSHPAYAELRLLRADLSAQNQTYSGCVLALGLEDYSERGMDYVNSVRTVIRGNRLEPVGNGNCHNVPTQITAEQNNQSEEESLPEGVSEKAEEAINNDKAEVDGGEEAKSQNSQDLDQAETNPNVMADDKQSS